MDAETNTPLEARKPRQWRLPEGCEPAIRQLFAESGADRWHLSLPVFAAGLTRSAAKRFDAAAVSAERVQEYFATLHTNDLALACACGDGLEKAWDEFVREYRGYLRLAAATILRRPLSDAAATDLADSLFADLYGLAEGKAGGRSLFRYFHGRSSLKTWLRAVLSQRHIDGIRAGKKFESLDGSEEDRETCRMLEPSTDALPSDPRREVYLHRFREALSPSLATLDARESTRLRMYYADERTLAEIGQQLGEHESSVSRNLERVRRELRATVEGLLRAGKSASNGAALTSGMDDAQIELCLQYAADDAAIDLDKLFERREAKQLSAPDRMLDR